MTQRRLRRLNIQGMQRFRDYLRGGGDGPVPTHLLDRPDTSEPLEKAVFIAPRTFQDRYEFGCHLNTLLSPLDFTEISHDRGLWSALGLFWFDSLCPRDKTGRRDPKEEYRYILSDDYRHYYRHLVRTPWQLVRDHGENARFLLISPKVNSNPLSVHGEILEQFAGRQQVLRSKPIVTAANRLYLDKSTGRPRKGAAGSGRGSARRFGLVLRQLDLTYDPNYMTEDSFLDILPVEFDRWKPRAEPRHKGS